MPHMSNLNWLSIFFILFFLTMFFFLTNFKKIILKNI